MVRPYRESDTAGAIEAGIPDTVKIPPAVALNSMPSNVAEVESASGKLTSVRHSPLASWYRQESPMQSTGSSVSLFAACSINIGFVKMQRGVGCWPCTYVDGRGWYNIPGVQLRIRLLHAPTQCKSLLIVRSSGGQGARHSFPAFVGLKIFADCILYPHRCQRFAAMDSLLAICTLYGIPNRRTNRASTNAWR